MLELLLTFYKYNTWATTQLIQTLRQLSEDELNLPGCRGNGTTKETLGHLLSTEYSWFSMFDGSMGTQQAMAARLAPEKTASLDAAEASWKELDAKTWRYLNSLDEGSLQQVQTTSLPNGMQVSFTHWQMLLHVANHQSHTRGQIIAAIRRAGKIPGNFDMIRYFMMPPRQ